MRKIFTILTLITLLSCNNSREKAKGLSTNVNRVSGIEVIRLTDEVDHGLNHIIVNDTLEVLIYRGVESTSMIRIK